ncbi:urokinase plasminogen activator surface receptor-like isoform X2 [Scyliorhinus canicula]|uniref:urokinase plasminogen activator surface receptor-like isoform X2 n=1 Tax=Scyliorhinus canicula TaxID=7830 RepID=UPI0018F4A2E3|nr:urokinase plasminogen activator surface receptor-like isoform X2 [Scyliorhinus canicula]
MVKLFSGIIICALVTEVLTLKCYSCASSTENCSLQSVCNSAQNMKCKTIATKSSVGATKITKSCGICTEPLSLNTGTFAYFQGYRCCTSDLCNDISHQVEENTALNGLECHACQSNSAAVCARSTSIVKCVGIQNRCAYTYTQLPVIGQRLVIKGCASEGICKSPKSFGVFFGVQIISEMQCCQGNLCNMETTLPGRRCHSCIRLAGVCNSKPIQCISSSCTMASTKEVINGTSQEYFLKGCGNCFGSLSFNAGSFSVERADRCCQSDNCNNQTFKVERNTTLNGLMCYGCTAHSNQKCSDTMIMMNCLGKQTRCLHSTTTGRFEKNGIIKGCASENICNNPNALAIYGRHPKQDFYCCKESGCNLGSGSSAKTGRMLTYLLPQ